MKIAEVVDVKGFKTKEYIAKKKIFEDKYNLKIKEEQGNESNE